MFGGHGPHIPHVTGASKRRSSVASGRSSADGDRPDPNEEDTTVVNDGEKNLLLSIIAQLKPGADLSRITFPTFILEPRSMLERITNFMQHPETLLPMSQVEDPTQRFVSVVKFYLSGWHLKPPGVKKPLNPILGEHFACYWDLPDNKQAYYISEQTSHHPPKSSYFYMAPHHNIRIDGTLKPRSRCRIDNGGDSSVKSVEQRKERTCTLTQPNMYVRGILFGALKFELGDHSYVKCPELDLVADIEFRTKGFFTGTYNAIFGTIKRESTGEVLYEISGKWNEDMYIKDMLTGKTTLLFDATNAKPTLPLTRPIQEQDDRESQKLWYPTVSALNKRDQDIATEEKGKVEDRQREEAREREGEGVEWTPRLFKPTSEDGLDFILSTPITATDPEGQIKEILAITPILPGSTNDGRFEIPPHRQQQQEQHPVGDAPPTSVPAAGPVGQAVEAGQPAAHPVVLPPA